jgi:hypothetical protein
MKTSFAPDAAKIGEPAGAPLVRFKTPVCFLGAQLAVLLLCVAVFASPGFAQTEKVVKQFGAGFGGDSVGIFEGGEDTEIEGPQAIYSGDHGEVYLLDQVNSRVVSFDPQQPAVLTRSLSLPTGIRPTDLIVNQGNIYVWDGHPIPLETSGEGLTRSIVSSPETRAMDDTTASMFAQTGSEEETSDKGITRGIGGSAAAPRAGNRQLLASRGKGPVVIDVSRKPNDTEASLDVREKNGSEPFAKLNIKVGDKLGAVEFIEIDHAGKMYVLAENVPAYATEGASTFVARYAASGVFEGVYELPLTQSVALSRRFVTVSPDGDVYFMRTRKGVVDVIGVGFRPMKNGQVVMVHGPVPNYAALALDRKGGPVAAVRPLTRERVLETAFAFESINWRLSPSSYGPDPDTSCEGFERIRRPGYLIGHVNQTVRGIPYCWGCQGSLGQIAAKLDRGGLAGNVCTRNNPRPDVIGVDCSSFVSAAWGLSTHFTTVAIPSISTAVEDPWQLKPGDALVKPGSHVVLFLGFTPDRKAEVMEASPGACNGRVCRNVYPLASLIGRGYLPRRFRALE